MIRIDNKEKCCGCNACAQICPRNCIDMTEDMEGFLYPIVYEEKCVNCGLCEKSCPMCAGVTRHVSTNEIEAFAGYTNDAGLRKISSSGGIFPELAKEILRRKGIVFGAAFDIDYSVHHIMVESAEDLYQLQGSKYVQSRIDNSFQKAKEYLEKGRFVLFSGTGCQIAGLKTFLGKEYDLLYTVDVFCHGVPSPKVWQLYLEEKKSTYHDSICKVDFRNKSNGWHHYEVLFEFMNGMEYTKYYNNDQYMEIFLSDICLRPSCYSCNYKPINSVADISLGDCWGIEKYDPMFDDDKGCSLIMLHNNKGEELLTAISRNLSIKPVDYTELYQAAFDQSAKKHARRERFVSCIEKNKSINEMYRLILPTFREKISYKYRILVKTKTNAKER